MVIFHLRSSKIRWLVPSRTSHAKLRSNFSRLFIAVCEERNIANAAKREAIVPSAVSKRISQMEQEAGVQLLERAADAVSR